MNESFFRIGLLTLILIWVNPTNGRTQEPLPPSNMEQDFAEAMVYLNSFKNDSANLILTKLVTELAALNQLDTPFGLKVQLRQAEVLEKDHQDEIAIQKLLHVVEASQKLNQWEVHAHAHLSLARLHEKMNRAENCWNNLQHVAATIKQHGVEQVYPRYAVRVSSYHRQFSNLDSAIFYAQEVLRTAPQFELYEDEATGHLLMGMLLSNSDYEKATQHFLAAGKRWNEVEDYSGYGAILSNLSKLHLRNNKVQLALSYNDSALIAASNSIGVGNESPWIFYTGYQQRARIYNEMGQHDSAWYYLQKGYEMELNDAYKSNNEKVVEIDARYQDEKKAQQIEDQAQLIQYQRERRNWLWGMFSVALIFASIITYYYLRLRKANRKTTEQALALSEANEELSISLEQQIMLQGEVHHRVKNNLQVIISLLELQQEDILDPVAKKSIETMSNRIYSIAAIHELLHQKKGNKLINLLDYTNALCRHYKNFTEEQAQPIFQLDIENRYFNLETLMPIGIILNELLTNSLKYANGLGKQLTIGIKLDQLPDGLCIRYRDNGPGFPKGILEERNGGLGTYLLKSMSRQLNGYLVSSNDGGAVCNIYFKEKNK